MAEQLKGLKVAFIVSNEGIEQAELTGPWEALSGAGAEPELLAREPGQVQAFNHLDPADKFDVDRTTAEAAPADYAALVLPGGVANGDSVRTDPGAVASVRDFAGSGRPIAAICHGGGC